MGPGDPFSWRGLWAGELAYYTVLDWDSNTFRPERYTDIQRENVRSNAEYSAAMESTGLGAVLMAKRLGQAGHVQS